MADPTDGEVNTRGGDLAVQTLRQLRNRWGVVDIDNWKIAPQLIRVNGMDWVETWRLRAAHQQALPKTVDLNTYELASITKVDR